MRWIKVMLVCTVLLLGSAAAAIGFGCMPVFTPVHAVEHAELILELGLGYPDKDGKVEAAVVSCLKGRTGDRTMTIDLSAPANPEHGKAVRYMLLEDDPGPALLLKGSDESGKKVVLLHICGRWLRLNEGRERSVLELEAIDSHLEATWAGDTEGLLKTVELVLRHPDTHVPVATSAAWDDPVRVGAADGRVSEVRAVDLGGGRGLWLHVSCPAGDRLIGWDRKAREFKDRAGERLAARSLRSAWGDFNGDKRLDLASWDGSRLTVWLQGADGRFSDRAVPDIPARECLGLEAMDAGVPGRAGLLWSTPGMPILLVPETGGSGTTFSQRALLTGSTRADRWGPPGRCLVADFDGDGLADVLQPFAKGSRICRGAGGGRFARAVPCSVQLGEGRIGAFLGDWNADGRIDVFACAEDASRIWQNSPDGFEEKLPRSGEIAYLSQPGAIGGQCCDINGDGLQDVALFYGADCSPQFFFNRGFRSLSHAHKPTDLAETGHLPEAARGQQGGAVADFNGDGVPDLAVVLADGGIWLLAGARVGDEDLSASVSLASGGEHAGPLTIGARTDRRELGAWVVSPGIAGPVLARQEPGEVIVTWRLPGGKPQSRTLSLEGRPVRLEIPATP
ncbi:MAG TPA: VCBS repeat-containing protein [Planctomycetota bacterium]|nr:VCBS repeat-containing protein [Planctomycetota bacterium]